MNYLTETQLRQLPTPRLLAYKRKHLPSENYPFGYDDYIWDCECSSCTETKILNKRYNESYLLIKKILNEREHVQ